MERRNHNAESGFTMVEALVALVVFGVGTVALLTLAPRATQFSSRGNMLASASQLAQAKVEELRALANGNADLAAGDHVDAGNPLEGSYRRRWTVTEDNPIAGMRRVDMYVAFPTSSPDSVVQVTTYF